MINTIDYIINKSLNFSKSKMSGELTDLYEYCKNYMFGFSNELELKNKTINYIVTAVKKLSKYQIIKNIVLKVPYSFDEYLLSFFFNNKSNYSVKHSFYSFIENISWIKKESLTIDFIEKQINYILRNLLCTLCIDEKVDLFFDF